MATVVKRSSSSRLKSSSTSSTNTTVTSQRRSTRSSEAAAANTGDMSLTIEASAASRDARMLTPPPMSARSELALRLGEVSMNSPVSERRGSAAQNNAAASQNNAAAPSLRAQNRALLLSGLPKGQDSPQSESSRASSPGAGIQRRDSGNGSLVGNRRLTPLVTVTASGSPQSQNQNRRHLSAHPNLSSPVAQSPRIISPCVYVKAVGLRRPSAGDTDLKDEDAEITEKDKSKNKSSASSINSDSLLSTPPPESRLSVAARITPVNADKKPFTLRREFDLQELVDALPRPDNRRPSTVNILASPTVHGSMPFSFTSPSPTTSKKRPASDTAPASPHPNVRRQTRQSTQQQQPPQLTPVKELPSPSQFAANGRIPIPILPHPYLGRIPGLAAIILSRRVEAGDMIEIPVPFPEAWPMTVSYVYDSTGDAEASSEVKSNLEHLGGSVIEK